MHIFDAGMPIDCSRFLLYFWRSLDRSMLLFSISRRAVHPSHTCSFVQLFVHEYFAIHPHDTRWLHFTVTATSSAPLPPTAPHHSPYEIFSSPPPAEAAVHPQASTVSFAATDAVAQFMYAAQPFV